MQKAEGGWGTWDEMKPGGHKASGYTGEQGTYAMVPRTEGLFTPSM